MLKTVMFFQNGNIGAFDEHGKQVPSEQMRCTWQVVLEDMTQRGVVNDDTIVMVPWNDPDTGKFMERPARYFRDFFDRERLTYKEEGDKDETP